ncbi:MAG: NAD(P)-dependent oxidoreductase [Halioglobus sp.]
MAQVGFIGLGKMGLGMAGRLLLAGHTLSVYNRTPEKAARLVELGACLAATPRAAASGADMVIAMLSDDHASRQVWLGDQGALSATMADGAMVVECSTLSYPWVQELSREVRDKKLVYLDCPVTGLPDAAAAGELTLFLGGEGTDIERARPLLESFSKSLIHFGDIGAGTSYKLIVNLMGSVQILATAEAMSLASRLGLDLQQVSDALAAGAAASANVIRCAEQMVHERYSEDVPFSAELRLKDTGYGVQLFDQFDQAEVLGSASQSAFQRVVDAGFGGFSESKVVDLLGDK